jgi:hypothetical protein
MTSQTLVASSTSEEQSTNEPWTSWVWRYQHFIAKQITQFKKYLYIFKSTNENRSRKSGSKMSKHRQTNFAFKGAVNNTHVRYFNWVHSEMLSKMLL